MHRRYLAPLVLFASLAFAPAAFAGGWAVTTLDEVPATLQADQTYAIGYTIRQHGVTPLITSQSAIEVRHPTSGATQRFAGKAEGPPGHYVALVRFTGPGEWAWSADQTPFQPQALGTIAVLPMAAPAAPVAAAASVATAAPIAPPAVATAPAPAPVAVANVPAPASTQPSVPVLAAPALAPAAVAINTAWPAPLRIGLPVATMLATAIFAWRLVAFVRVRQAPAAVR